MVLEIAINKDLAWILFRKWKMPFPGFSGEVLHPH
jgi:hypothetical protein